MEKDYLSVDEKIIQNKELLEFCYSNYQRTQAKLSVLVLIYSLFAIYFIQIVSLPVKNFDYFRSVAWVYIPCLLFFLLFLFYSIRHAYELLKPSRVAYIRSPKYFYQDLRTEYEMDPDIDSDDLLNEYIKYSHLSQLEEAVAHNTGLIQTKSQSYATAFNTALVSGIFYIFSASFILSRNAPPQEINISNYKSIIKTLDSLQLDRGKFEKMIQDSCLKESN